MRARRREARLMHVASLPSIVIFFALALIVVVAPLASALLARRARSGERARHARYARSLLILWSMTWLSIYALSLWGQRPADVGWLPPSNPVYPYLLVFVFIGILALLGARAARSVDQSYAQRIRLIAPATPNDWLWYVPVALTAGICEEFLYRGYALHVVAALTHSVTAGVVVSTAAFGIAHMYQGRRGVIGTTVFGLVFAFVVVVWGSLWPCMIAHALQDLIGGALVSRRLASMPESSGDAPLPAEAQPDPLA